MFLIIVEMNYEQKLNIMLKNEIKSHVFDKYLL